MAIKKTHDKNILPNREAFLKEIKEDFGDSRMKEMGDRFGKPEPAILGYTLICESNE